MESTLKRPLFMVKSKDLKTHNGNYIQGDVNETGYTPIGFLSIDGTGIASTNTIRLFYISVGGVAAVYWHETPAANSYVTANIIYQRN